MKFEEYCRQANPEVSEVQTWTRSGQRIVRPLCRFFPQEKKGLVRLLKHRKEGGWWKEAARKRNMGQEGGEPAITWKKSRGKGGKKRKKSLFLGIYGKPAIIMMMYGSDEIPWPSNGSRRELCKAHCCTNCQLQDSSDLLRSQLEKELSACKHAENKQEAAVCVA